MNQQSKTCTSCGEAKPRTAFGSHRGRADGLQDHCRDCLNEARRARYRSDPAFRAERTEALARWNAENPERAKAARARSRERNRERARDLRRRWKAANPEKVAASSRRNNIRRYGITPEQFDEMLESQGGCCALCGTTEPGGRGTWHIDHDHTCCPTRRRSCGKCVRGLLCAVCNLNQEKRRAA